MTAYGPPFAVARLRLQPVAFAAGVQFQHRSPISTVAETQLGASGGGAWASNSHIVEPRLTITCHLVTVHRQTDENVGVMEIVTGESNLRPRDAVTESDTRVKGISAVSRTQCSAVTPELPSAEVPPPSLCAG